MYNGRIVIPNDLQSKILEIIHHGHQGITKCNERAKEAVWWFGIGKDIKSIVGRCKECQVKKVAQRREPLTSSPLPKSRWSVDLLSFKGKTFLVAMDYYSWYLEDMHVLVERDFSSRDSQAQEYLRQMWNPARNSQ